MQSDDFAFTEENFLKLEELLGSRRPGAEDLWTNRVSLFSCLAATPFVPTGKKYKLGLASYFLWILSKVWSPKSHESQAAPPAADFLVHLIGDVSKEVDTLLPVISALREANCSVLVLWMRNGPIPDEFVKKLNEASVWIPPPEIEFTPPRSLIISDILCTCRLLIATVSYLRSLKGFWTAFFKRSVAWFHHLFYLKRWERFLAFTLADHSFKGVAVVSETAYSALALCRVANQRGWPIHHFLHGLPTLMHTRQEATHMHCFSEIERNFFINHGWTGNRVHAAGHPRQVEMLKQIHNIRELLPEEGGIRALFTSTGGFAGFETGGFDFEYRQRVLATIFEAVARISPAKIDVRIRPHPSEDQLAQLRTLRQFAPSLMKPTISSRPLVHDLAWANVVLTDFSTTAIESCYAGCFLIWLTLGKFRYKIRDQLIERGYGHYARSPEDLSRELDICFDSAIRAQLIRDFVATGRTLGIVNPKAATNAAEIMMHAPESINGQENFVPVTYPSDKS